MVQRRGIHGGTFTGHAIDQLQNRQLNPAIVENAIETGKRVAGNQPYTSVFANTLNSVCVVVNDLTTAVITVE